MRIIPGIWILQVRFCHSLDGMYPMPSLKNQFWIPWLTDSQWTFSRSDRLIRRCRVPHKILFVKTKSLFPLFHYIARLQAPSHAVFDLRDVSARSPGFLLSKTLSFCAVQPQGGRHGSGVSALWTSMLHRWLLSGDGFPRSQVRSCHPVSMCPKVQNG